MRIALLAAVMAAVVHVAGWIWANQTVTPADVSRPISYVSYSPYTGGHTPRDGKDVPPEHILSDLKKVAEVATGVRTYSTQDGVDQVPAIAQKLGLDVMLGAWVGDTPERDQNEVDTVVSLAKQHRNVRAVLVGNETLLRGERTPDEMIAMIQKVKKQVRVPVSTGDIWYTWIRYPQLAKAVDFLAVHILPYWEGVAPEDAVSYALDKIELLKKTFPGKRIVVAEFGWPSQGYNNLDAQPGALSQADIIRNFLAEADKRGIEYNIVEAFDQTWKTSEGSVGAYWGLFNDDRNLKFPLTGEVVDQNIGWKGALAVVVGALLTVVGLRGRRPTWAQALVFAAGANAVGLGLASAVAYPFEHYFNPGILAMWSVGFVLVMVLALLTLAKVDEIASVVFGRAPRRLVEALGMRPLTRAPMVSIHIPAYREPPAMVIETLNSMAALDYPNFEVLVVINNTPEASYSAPVAARCRELGDRFKFLDFTCTGFKAGALNIALQEHTDPAAEIIAVVDADYVVERNWLRDLVPYFNERSVGLVQAPQDHRDGYMSPLKRMMDNEFAGFFDIGMVQRNEDDAIIQHGTMCLVRREALERVGGWSTETICEDTELGLRLFEAGYQAHYTQYRYGRGLLPDTFQAFKTQRFRWAFGAMQIIRKHWRHMMPGADTLDVRQKFHFLAGWSLWLTDAAGVALALLSLLWVPIVLFVGVIIPETSFTIPILIAFVVNILHCGLLYAKRVRVPSRNIPGAAVAAMSLQWTVARAVGVGLVHKALPFKRTEKGGNAKRTTENPALWETRIGIALVLAAFLLIFMNEERIVEMTLYAITLLVQSVPFIAAGVMVGIERYQERAQAVLQAKPVTAGVAVPAGSELR